MYFVVYFLQRTEKSVNQKTERKIMKFSKINLLFAGIILGGLLMFLFDIAENTGSASVQKLSVLNASDSYMVNTTGASKEGVGLVQQILTSDASTGVSLVKVGSATNSDGFVQYAWMTETPTNGMSVKLVRVHMQTPIPFDSVVSPSSSLLAIPIR
jgi:hypothetical protein